MTSTAKYIVLDEEGFWFHPHGSVYVNTYKRKIFSRDAVEDNPLSWLRESILEDSRQHGWQFYFNTPPDEDKARKVLKEIFPSHTEDTDGKRE